MSADRPLGYRTQTSVVSAAPPEVVFDTIADLRNHLDWSGERASSETFKLLSMEAPEGPAVIGTAFASSGSADNGTFHDRSEVTVASGPTTFVIETADVGGPGVGVGSTGDRSQLLLIAAMPTRNTTVRTEAARRELTSCRLRRE